MGDLTEIQVTPKQLIKSAELMSKTMSKAFKAVSRMSQLAQSTENCFVGKAGEAFRMGMQENVKAWEEQIKNMEGSATELQEIAEEYENAEGGNINAVDGIIL